MNARPIKWERTQVRTLSFGLLEEVEIRRTTYRYPGSLTDPSERYRVRYVVGEPGDNFVEEYDVPVNAHPARQLEHRAPAEARLWERLAPHPSVIGFVWELVDYAP